MCVCILKYHMTQIDYKQSHTQDGDGVITFAHAIQACQKLPNPKIAQSKNSTDLPEVQVKYVCIQNITSLHMTKHNAHVGRRRSDHIC